MGEPDDMATKSENNGANTTGEKVSSARRALSVRALQVPGRDRVLRFIASTEEVARDGDIVRVSGWETDKFMQNPVFLWAHSHEAPPIGRVLKVKKVLRPKDGNGPRLEIDVEFAGIEQLHDDAERVYLLYRDGFLRAVSVSFFALEYQDLTPEQKADLGLATFGRVIKRAELLEVSAVPIPADTGAVLIEDEEDRAVCKAALLSVRSAAPAEEQTRFDALAASLDTETETAEVNPPPPEWQSVTTSATTTGYLQTNWTDPFDSIRSELSALRALVEERLPAQVREVTAEVTPPAPPTPADVAVPDPAATEPPTTETTPTTPSEPPARDGDFYGLLDAHLSRMTKKE